MLCSLGFVIILWLVSLGTYILRVRLPVCFTFCDSNLSSLLKALGMLIWASFKPVRFRGWDGILQVSRVLKVFAILIWVCAKPVWFSYQAGSFIGFYTEMPVSLFSLSLL